MRSLLRYLKGDMKVVLKLPHDSDVLKSDVFQTPHIVAFSDASHAPMKSTGRRGVSGIPIFLVFYTPIARVH